jgi:purine-nucleoside phosphorylase
MLYASLNRPGITFIHTGIGAGLAGDAVLYLKETSCRKMVLFGSCGLVKEKDGLGLGSLVSPCAAYAYESFSDLLAGDDLSRKIAKPDPRALEQFLSAGARQVVCATFGSLKLEETRRGELSDKGIDVLDMECSAVFAAARHTGLPAAALFFVSDVLTGRQYDQPATPHERRLLADALERAHEKIVLFSPV